MGLSGNSECGSRNAEGAKERRWEVGKVRRSAGWKSVEQSASDIAGKEIWAKNELNKLNKHNKLY